MTNNLTSKPLMGEAIMAELITMQIDPLPSCYETWYCHRRGDILALSSQIEKVLESDGDITAELLGELHKQHCLPLHLTDIVPQFFDTFEGSAKALNTIAASLSKSTNEINTDASQAIKKLDAPNLEPIEMLNIIRTLSHNARSSVERNLTLEKDLHAATTKIDKLKTSLTKYEYDAHVDSLTQLKNRRYFDKHYALELKRAKEFDHPLSIIVCDIDHFKSFNDKWGHSVGDLALRFAANILARNTKGKDIVARYGGEEFVIILPETNIEKAATLAENIRHVFCKNKLYRKSTDQELGILTMSFGVAQNNPTSTTQQLFEAADAALYKAKNLGRNQVVRDDQADSVSEEVDDLIQECESKLAS